MMSKEKVLSVGYAKGTYNCITIGYQKDDYLTFAAVSENLSVKVGDLVWVLHNSRLDYKGFNSVAVLLA